MPLDVRLFPCLSDNYGFLVRDAASGAVAAVDTPDAEAVLADLNASGWGRLDMILNTHWHPDHTQGNARLKDVTGCTIVGPAEVAKAAPIDRIVGEGDTVRLGDTGLDVLETPGHTLGHVVYHDPAGRQAFVGDVMFALGCGRLFEGMPEQMFESLKRLASWPDETVVWCAHEYTAANARFALTIDDRENLGEHARSIFAAREAGRPTVPTTIGVERSFNPFVRCETAQAFAVLRRAKDAFTG